MHKTLSFLSNVEPTAMTIEASGEINFKCISYNPPQLYLVILLSNIFKTAIGAIWTVQRAKAFAVKPDDPNGPGTCLVEGQTNQLTQVVL